MSKQGGKGIKRENQKTHSGAAVGSKHALAESFRPILSAKEVTITGFFVCHRTMALWHKANVNEHKPSYSCFREWGSSISKVVMMPPTPDGRPIKSASHARAMKILVYE